MRIRRALIASAVLVGLGVTGQAWAQASNDNNARRGVQTAIDDDSDNSDNSNHGRARASDYGSAAANNSSTATSSFSNSFNSSKAIAETRLDGYVTDIRIRDIGNVANNWGDADGGHGGAGGSGGSVSNDAGAFNMSSNMTNVGQSAAGIMTVAQNSGFASLIQQGVTVQANLTVGP